GQLVAQAGINALMNWSANYLVAVNREHQTFVEFMGIMMARCAANPLSPTWGPAKTCSCLTGGLLNVVIIPRLFQEVEQKSTMFTYLEDLASAQSMQRAAAAVIIFGEQNAMLGSGLRDEKLKDQVLASNIAKEANYQSRWPGELSAPKDSAYTSLDELLG